MNYPNVIAELIEAQNLFDSNKYADCFAEAAVVVDEEQTYNGKDEIRNWINETNKKYKVVMEPIAYKSTQTTGVLTAKISGTFEGSPVLLDYHLEITEDKINHLEITVNEM